MQDKSYLTARWRKNVSGPTKFLINTDRIRERTLDYGCGRGYDARQIGAHSYDPYYQPVMPDGQFDTIICNYVLNVIPDLTTRNGVLELIRSKLAPGGLAYISVRNDRAALNGYTKRGSWQGLVVLDLPVVTTNRVFTMYRMEK